MLDAAAPDRRAARGGHGRSRQPHHVRRSVSFSLIDAHCIPATRRSSQIGSRPNRRARRIRSLSLSTWMTIERQSFSAPGHAGTSSICRCLRGVTTSDPGVMLDAHHRVRDAPSREQRRQCHPGCGRSRPCRCGAHQNNEGKDEKEQAAVPREAKPDDGKTAEQRRRGSGWSANCGVDRETVQGAHPNLRADRRERNGDGGNRRGKQRRQDTRQNKHLEQNKVSRSCRHLGKERAGRGGGREGDDDHRRPQTTRVRRPACFPVENPAVQAIHHPEGGRGDEGAVEQRHPGVCRPESPYQCDSDRHGPDAPDDKRRHCTPSSAQKAPEDAVPFGDLLLIDHRHPFRPVDATLSTI